MLVRVLYKNFLSFHEGTEFNMLPNLKRKRFPKHVYDKKPIPVLKTSAIYGANGAGKSNILKGIQTLKLFVVMKDYMQKVDFFDYRFKLKENNQNDPISISIEFINNDKTFYYHIELKENRIELEELYTHDFSTGKDVPVFIATQSSKARTIKVYNANGSENKQYIDSKIISILEKNATSSILSLQKEYPIVPDKLADLALDWFDSKLYVLSIGFQVSDIIDLLDTKKAMTSFVNKMLSEMSIGIDQVLVRTRTNSEFFAEESAKTNYIQKNILEQSEKSIISVRSDNKHIYSFCEEKGENVVKDLVFKQQGLGEYVGDMDILSQSDGTVALLSKIPFLYDLINKDYVFLVDEIESSLHPHIVEKIISFFTNKASKGQLMFTTHEVSLLNQKLLRADEVWFVEKSNGCSRMYSLNDFKEHSTIDIEKGYLSGRYGAIPFIGNKAILED